MHEGVRRVIHDGFCARQQASATFFDRESDRLAEVCRSMSSRFARGGRLLSFGAGAAASDAQHIAVEFVHPVLVGKRALAAVDLSASYRMALSAIVREADIAIGLGPPEGDRHVAAGLEQARAVGALCLALPGSGHDYAIQAPSQDPFVHQEIVETLYHTLWETVHVFFEREAIGYASGAAAFLYPFLDSTSSSVNDVIPEVAASIRFKATTSDVLRADFVQGQSDALVSAALAIHHQVVSGGTVLCFGNGGSATDATDLAVDLVSSPKGHCSVPALSLASDAAILTALGNDIGQDALFARQVIAHGRPQDVAIAFSTSGASRAVSAGLVEARARGMLTVALLGYGGGDIYRRKLADHMLIVNSDQIPRVQEVHASIYHVLLDLLEHIGTGTP